MSPRVPANAPLIGFGQVRHTRLRPSRNAFNYPTYFLMLPMRSLFGYAPGARDASALNALVMAYCVLPCGLKLAAAAALYVFVIQPGKTAS